MIPFRRMGPWGAAKPELPGPWGPLRNRMLPASRASAGLEWGRRPRAACAVPPKRSDYLAAESTLL